MSLYTVAIIILFYYVHIGRGTEAHLTLHITLPACLVAALDTDSVVLAAAAVSCIHHAVTININSYYIAIK